MTMFFATVFLIIFGAETLMGITTNAFIVVVNLLSWAKGIVLNANDQLLLSLGLSNLYVQGTSAMAGLSFFFYQELFYKGFGSQVFQLFFVFSNSISVWLTSVLLLSYSLMMNRTPHRLFLWMKRIFIKNSFWLLSSFFLAAFGFGLLASVCAATYMSHNVAANLTSNSSKPFFYFCNSTAFRLTVILQYLGPFVTASIHVIQIVTDIWKHIWNIKTTMAGTGEPILKAHRDATRTLTALLVLHLFYTFTYIVTICNIFSFSSIWFLMCVTMFSILTSAQAVTLIVGIPRLKKEAQRILQSFSSSTADERGKSTDAISYVTPPE